jgi:hypothetical protein
MFPRPLCSEAKPNCGKLCSVLGQFMWVKVTVKSYMDIAGHVSEMGLWDLVSIIATQHCCEPLVSAHWQRLFDIKLPLYCTELLSLTSLPGTWRVANLFFLTCISIASCVFFPSQYRNRGPNRNVTLCPNPNPDPNYKANRNPNPTINPQFTSFDFLRNGHTG